VPRLRDKDKTQEQLLKEIAQLRQRVAVLERTEKERQQAEESLRESEEELEAIFNEARDGIVLLDLTGKIIKINKRITEVTGYTEKYIVGKRFNFFKNFPPQSVAKMVSAFTKTVAGKRVPPFEVVGYTKTGEKRIGEIYGSLLQKRGKTVGVLVVMTDITERKQAENALRESEQKYRTILETMKEGYYETNLAGNFTFFNDAMCRIHGYTRDELMGMNNRAYSSPETAKKIYQIYKEVYKTGIPARIVDYKVIKKDGSIVMIETSASLLRDAAGEPIGYYGVSRDRTKQKKAEEALRQSEEKYRTILENIEDGYYEVDLAGNLTFFNDSACRIFGYTRDELMGMNNRAYMDEETAKKVYNIFTNVFRTGKSTTIYDWQIIRKDGSKVDFEASVSLIRDASGNPTGFRGIVRDITERKRAEEALRESEEKYRNILASIQEGYFETDLDGNYTFVNDANCRYLGYTREELIGMNYRQHTEEKIVEKLYPHYRKLYDTGKPIESLEFEAVRKDGTKVIYETSVTLMRNSKGKPIGFRGVSRDITERKRAEEALREREERYRHILELAPDGITINRLKDGRYLQVNNAFCQHTGYSPDEVLGRTPSDLDLYVDPADRERLVKAVRQHGRTDGLEISFRAKDGSILEDLVSARPIRFQGEDCQLVMATNINALKQAQQALRESEQKHRTILETMKEGYYETDLEGNFTFCNEALCGIFKCRHEDLIGLHYQAYLSPEGTRKMYAIFSKVYKTGIPAPIIDYKLIRKDGSVTMIETSASLLRNAAGEPIGFYGVSRDRTEQKKAEEALRQSEEKYRTILETMEEGYYEVDLRGSLTFFNEAECRIHRRSRDEMMGLDNRDFSSPETSKRIYAICNKVYRTGIPAKIVDYEIIRKDGSIALLEASVSLFRNAAGEPIGFRGVTRDRTEQKKAEEALRQSEEKYRTILESIEDGYYEVDLSGNLRFCNEALRRIHGRSHDEMMGINNREFSSPETAKKVYTVFNKVYRTGIPAKIIDYEVIRKDGSVARIEESVSLLRNAAGEPIGFYGVSRDRTEQKKAEEALRQSEEKYRTILENIEDGYYEVDLSGNLTFFNDAMCRIYGSTRDNMTGMNNRAYMDEETAKKTYRLFNQVYRTGEAAKIFDWEFIKEDGSIITVEMSVSLRRDSTGKPVGFRGIIRDITERKRADEALRESEEKYRSLVEFTEDSVYLVNRKKEYLFANEAYLSRLGLPRDRVMGRPYSEFHSPEDDKVFSGHIEQVLKTGRFVQYEHRSQKDNRYFLRTLSPVKESDGYIEAVTVIAKDITERKRAETELVYMATHDVLTGLPNRMLFNDRLTIALTQARRSQKKLAVMLLDLDYFKDVNDALGHGVGDQLLSAVGKRLRKFLRRGDTVARIGGDEFLLLLPEMLQIEYATTIAQKILQTFQEPFTFDDHKLQISASIGVTIYPDDGDDIDTLMKHADTAMYRAKDKGRDRLERYIP